MKSKQSLGAGLQIAFDLKKACFELEKMWKAMGSPIKGHLSIENTSPLRS
jgi:hypothetical protein